MRIVTTWNGAIFDQMPYDKAEKLEKAHQLQIIRAGCVDGSYLKTAAYFRAAQAKADPPPNPKVEPKIEPKVETKADPEPADEPADEPATSSAKDMTRAKKVTKK